MNKLFAIDKNEQLKALVANAEPGEQLALTVNGKVVANLVLSGEERDRSKAVAAMGRILERSKTASLGDLKIADLIREGRKY